MRTVKAVSSGKVLTTEEFIKRAKEKHGDKYDYSLAEYKNYEAKVRIVCPTHGAFLQRPSNHLKGSGCPVCGKYNGGNKTGRISQEEFIRRAKEKHTDRYDYSLTEYKNMRTKISIVCPIHGEFCQTPGQHLYGQGCPKCYQSARTLSTAEFISEAEKVHGNIYDYSKVRYVNCCTKVNIVCPKHGDFFQQPRAHLAGEKCRFCQESQAERTIRMFLEKNGYKRFIDFFPQKEFRDCLGKSKQPLTFDFYIPAKNLLIEYNGEQHYLPSRFRHHDLKEQRHRDWLKRKYARSKSIQLLVIPYWEFKNINKILEESI